VGLRRVVSGCMVDTSSGEALSREEKHFLEWGTVFSSGEAFPRVEKRFLDRRSVFSKGP
jgi:hypothetical protein